MELTDPAVDHTAVIRQAPGLSGLDVILSKLGLKKGGAALAATQVSAPVSNRAPAVVTEERGKQQG